MRQSNTHHRNISFDVNRKRYRVEMRFAGAGSRTARVGTLQEALALRSTWSIERDQLLKSRMLEKTTETSVFSIEHRRVVVRFD